MPERIKFYSASDWSSGYYLEKAENRLLQNNIDIQHLDINDIIELYNVSLFFDNKVYLKTWDEEKISTYILRIKKIKGIIGKYMSLINEDNLEEHYKKIEASYTSDFWEMFSYYKLCRRISCQAIQKLINDHPTALRNLLHQKSLVIKYDATIKDLIVANVEFTELILNCYLVKHDNNTPKLYIPQSFGEKEQILVLKRYIEWDGSNPNYLQLISSLKKHDDFVADDRIRYTAHKKYVERMKELFADNNKATTHFGISVVFYDDSKTDEPPSMNEPGVQLFNYGTSWFCENLDYPTLLNNFIYIFGFVDSQFRYQHLSNPSRIGIFESLLGVHGVREYSTGSSYHAITILSLAQMTGYTNVLKENGIMIENIFKWFFETYLKEEFNAEGFVYSAPSDNASFLEKILLLISQIDSVIKQYRYYQEDGYINREFFEFSSQMYRLSNTPSMLKEKYIYPNSVEIKNAMHYLYSDQSLVTYTDKTQDKYDTLPQLLMNENLCVSDFANFSQPAIKWLMEKGYIYEDGKHCIRINKERAYILKDLFENGVISISYFDGKLRDEIETLIQQGDLCIENTLFTRQEQEYIDYMLNVQRFNNGPEIRNKYVHGTYSLDEQLQQKDYLELLKIMVLIIIKINEEFCLR